MDNIGQASAASIERQLGEVVGTVKMTVVAIEGLKESVERLAERAAFKGELEAVRTECKAQLDEVKKDLTDQIKSEKNKVDELRKYMWQMMGACAVGLIILQVVLRGINITFGAGD